MIDYDWIAQVQSVVKDSSIFGGAILGGKALAMSFLLFKVMGHFLQTAENEEKPPIGGLINIIGFGLIIVGGDFIINSIEQVFAGVDVDLAGMNQSYAISPCATLLDQIHSTADTLTGIDKVAFYFSVSPSFVVALLTWIVATIFHLIDVAITSMYLLQRIFLLNLFVFIFPLALAFSTLDKMSDMLWRWIKIYIGLFILGIAYTAIIKFSVIIYDVIQQRYNVKDFNLGTPISDVVMAELGALLVMFTVKIGLMGFVTKEIRGYFN